MQMKALKEMIECIRQGFDNFQLHILTAVKQFRKSQDLNRLDHASKKLAHELNSKVVHQSYSTTVINTLGTSIDNFTKQVEEMASDIHKKANLLYQDLIEPLDLYYKHYHSKNRDILQDC